MQNKYTNSTVVSAIHMQLWTNTLEAKSIVVQMHYSHSQWTLPWSHYPTPQQLSQLFCLWQWIGSCAQMSDVTPNPNVVVPYHSALLSAMVTKFPIATTNSFPCPLPNVSRACILFPSWRSNPLSSPVKYVPKLHLALAGGITSSYGENN